MKTGQSELSRNWIWSFKAKEAKKMEIGSGFNIAEEALARDMDKMSEIAHEVANNTDASSMDLVTNMTDMTITQRNYEANIKVIQTLDDMYEEIHGIS
jgi:flagellar hook protein FlgE